MSVHISSAVWRLKLNPTEKVVLLKLADCCDDQGRNAFPCVARIAAECGMHERTVLRTLAKLRGAGLITVQRAATHHQPTVYQLHPDRGSLINEDYPRRAHQSRAGAVNANTTLRVFRGDNFKCRRCGSSDDLTVDHIDPDGGGDITNLQTLCRACNSAKGTKRPDNLSPLPAAAEVALDPDRGGARGGTGSGRSVEPSVIHKSGVTARARESAPVRGGGDPRAQRAYRAVENLTGSLNPTVADRVGEWLAAVTDGDVWIEKACEEAAISNARSWRYVEAILKRWRSSGFGAKRAGGAGAKPRAAAGGRNGSEYW